METEIQRLNNEISSLSFKFLGIQKKLDELIAKAPGKSAGAGVPVWESYKTAYMKRYKIEPVRNAKVNRNCSDIAKRLGKDAADVAKFYVLECNNPGWVQMNHPVGILLMNCESIHSMWKQGGMRSLTAARTDERRASNITASREYLEHKHGGSGDRE